MTTKYKIETHALHTGTIVNETSARATPVYRTSSYLFKDTEHAANLFSLKELGNIYTRLMNPTQDVLEKRVVAMEGGVAGLALVDSLLAQVFSDLEGGIDGGAVGLGDGDGVAGVVGMAVGEDDVAATDVGGLHRGDGVAGEKRIDRDAVVPGLQQEAGVAQECDVDGHVESSKIGRASCRERV